MSPVTCHRAPVIISNSHSQRPYPLLTPKLCKVGWFAETKNQERNKKTIKKNLKTGKNITSKDGLKVKQFLVNRQSHTMRQTDSSTNWHRDCYTLLALRLFCRQIFLFLFCNFSKTLLNQKSSVQAVQGPRFWAMAFTEPNTDSCIVTYRQFRSKGRIRGRKARINFWPA